MVLASLAFCYVLISLSLFIGIWRLKRKPAGNIAPSSCSGQIRGQERTSDEPPFVSILVPARDEEKAIPDCLESLVRQQYPSDKYEIVVVNDRSADRTPAIIEGYQKKYRMIKCVSIDSNSTGLTGKQNAISEGLKFCIGEIILNIDADCTAGPLWVRQTVSHFAPQVGVSVGFVLTKRRDASVIRSLFADIQGLDLLLLRYAAAGAAGMNVTAPCGGANLAYRKVVLDEVGYSEIGYALGEDISLIEAVAKNTDLEMLFIRDKDAAVFTSAAEGMRQFLSQRVRWVLGGRATGSWSQVPLHSMLLFHLCIVAFLPLACFERSLAAAVILSILIKASLDFIAGWRVCKEFERTDLLKLFIPYEFFLVFYSIIAGFGSIFIREVRWKREIYSKRAVKYDLRPPEDLP